MQTLNRICKIGCGRPFHDLNHPHYWMPFSLTTNSFDIYGRRHQLDSLSQKWWKWLLLLNSIIRIYGVRNFFNRRICPRCSCNLKALRYSLLQLFAWQYQSTNNPNSFPSKASYQKQHNTSPSWHCPNTTRASLDLLKWTLGCSICCLCPPLGYPFGQFLLRSAPES